MSDLAAGVRVGVSVGILLSTMLSLRTLSGEEGFWLHAGHSGISTFLLFMLIGISIPWPRPQYE